MTTLPNQRLYGRKFNLQVLLPPGDSSSSQTVLTISDSAAKPEPLRILFDVRTVFFQVAWYAEIVIYNLDQATTNQLLGGAGVGNNNITTPVKQGMSVVLSAGYQEGNYGLIWSGPVFQALFDREDGTNFKITLNCMLWLDPLTRREVNSTYAAGFNQTELIQQIAAKAFGASVPVNISPNVSSTKSSRGETFFGTATQFLNQFADTSNVQWFLDSRGLNFARVDDNIAETSPSKVFSPPPSPLVSVSNPSPNNGIIIGTPQQTQYGVDFTVLLDPTVVVKYPAMLIQIDNSQIVQLKRQQGEKPGILDQNGNYIVMGARYRGDTRGTAWYTDITGLTSAGGKMAMAQALAERASLNH